jgi:hypothetical protein
VTVQIVTSYLDSAARNMGFKEQLQVSVTLECSDEPKLTAHSTMKDMPKPKNM